MNKYGSLLKLWRKNRRLSQLQLAMEADVSSRHISFLETGRASPSRSMVQHLSDILAVPIARRNDLFEAAGFAHQQTRSSLTEDHMKMLSSSMAHILHRHEPYPAVIFDEDWTILQLNDQAKKLFLLAGLEQGSNLLDFITRPNAAAQLIKNWPEAGHHMLQRLRAESRAIGGSQILDEAIAKLAVDPAIVNYIAPTHLPPVLTTVFSLGPLELSLFTIVAQFGGAEDLTITDLKIELMFPADKETEAVLKSL